MVFKFLEVSVLYCSYVTYFCALSVAFLYSSAQTCYHRTILYYSIVRYLVLHLVCVGLYSFLYVGPARGRQVDGLKYLKDFRDHSRPVYQAQGL